MALLAEKALAVAQDYEKHLDNIEGLPEKTLADVLLEAELFHTRDTANMRATHPRFVAHEVVCLTFEDDSRLVRFTHHTTPPVGSDWTVVAPRPL